MNHTTQQRIDTVLSDLEHEADKIVSLVEQVQDGWHVTHPRLQKLHSLHSALTALQHIAQWSDPSQGPLLDEPHSTTTARQTLESIAKLYEH
jgi:hypothetical protein